MWVEELPSGKYRFVERCSDPVTGRVRRVSVTLDKNTAQSRKLAAELLRRKMDVSVSNITFGELCDMYLSDQKTVLKPSTWTRNKYALNTLKSILGENTKPESMSAGWIRRRMADTGKGAGTLNEHLKRLRTVLRWGFDNDIIPDIHCPKDFKDVPRRQKIEDKFLEAEELSALLDAMHNDLWHDLTAFLALSGLRFGEAAALERSDVDLNGRVITVNKTYDAQNGIITAPKTYDSVREVYIQDELYTLCRAILHRSVGVRFFTYTDKPISYRVYNNYLKAVSLDVLERSVTTHILRHTHASLLMEAGIDIDAISKRLGHSDSKITREIYLHVTEKLKEKRNAELKCVRLII